MISITTPSFNQGAFISDTLQSIAIQTGSSIEHTIYDGGSTDNTLDIIKAAQAQISYWESLPDRGQSHAINKGIVRATGDIFNWLNSDDLLAPNALTYIVNAFKNKATNIFIGRSIIFSSDGEEHISKGTDIYPQSLAKTIGRARIDQPEHWWRKSVIDEIGPLNEALHFTMDRDWWIKYLLIFGLEGIEKSDKVLAKFRLHDDSKTISQSQAFNQERNAYYHSLAVHYGFSEHADILKLILGASTIPMTNLPERINLDLLNEAFHHFFALLCEEAYADGNHTKALRITKTINSDYLNNDDKLMLDRIKFRARFPASLIKGFKTITGRK